MAREQISPKKSACLAYRKDVKRRSLQRQRSRSEKMRFKHNVGYPLTPRVYSSTFFSKGVSFGVFGA